MPNNTLRFLIVDEHSTMRRIVANLLKDSGYLEMDEADDGSMALHKLRNSRFDFVISATDMPRLGGLQLLSAMKGDAALRHIPVLLLTAEARRDEILLAAQLGAAGYVLKPFTKAMLEEKVLRIVKRSGLA